MNRIAPGNVHHLPPSPHLQTVTTTPDDSQAYTSHAVLESIILLCFMYGCIAYPLQTIHYIEYIALSLGRQEIPKYACRYIYVHNGVRVVVGLLTPYWLPLYNFFKKKDSSLSVYLVFSSCRVELSLGCKSMQWCFLGKLTT